MTDPKPFVIPPDLPADVMQYERGWNACLEALAQQAGEAVGEVVEPQYKWLTENGNSFAVMMSIELPIGTKLYTRPVPADPLPSKHAGSVSNGEQPAQGVPSRVTHQMVLAAVAAVPSRGGPHPTLHYQEVQEILEAALAASPADISQPAVAHPLPASGANVVCDQSDVSP